MRPVPYASLLRIQATAWQLVANIQFSTHPNPRIHRPERPFSRLGFHNAAISARQLQYRLRAVLEEFMDRFSDPFRPQIVVDQEHPSSTHTGIEELQGGQSR